MKGIIMSKCLDCKYFDPQCNECNKENHCYIANRDDEACDKFVQRKECEHKYENCDCNGCSIICHSYPSERGCDFYYECKLDNRYCDEKCEIHKDRYEIKNLSEEISKLYEAKRTIEKAIERYNENIKEIEERLNEKIKNIKENH